ncbi:hypothetical protein MCOR27_004320 [Pyricularia oryzae]|uniref:Uncharacterized protein n=3 Tax=Pyricularia oryzae TaxID=318829 RepID=G4N1A0_PYRO7|nr:uncharacterized protein MGG_16645 [Pyricularia oryzae 70-15]ELQ38104.1 hypothetical protein OOU_Y34scaffold00552g59 [Pyricularia oryzae Y34]KAH9428108.1 hypothetical protein MCOR02_011598 [Pyricularia oryzae]EHA51579.1 hypothetical protein MGG_16645 [Pyricularia oryzae 70-15]KAI6263462.1 hypothetical protein MCOR19_000361 [Pyricularia oryzae]KAI6281295.1 hypothetical protein MCOR27_004320 [Pyricularia oryzae]
MYVRTGIVSRPSYFLASPRGDISESTVVCSQNGRELAKVRCSKESKPTEALRLFPPVSSCSSDVSMYFR